MFIINIYIAIVCSGIQSWESTKKKNPAIKVNNKLLKINEQKYLNNLQYLFICKLDLFVYLFLLMRW